MISSPRGHATPHARRRAANAWPWFPDAVYSRMAQRVEEKSKNIAKETNLSNDPCLNSSKCRRTYMTQGQDTGLTWTYGMKLLRRQPKRQLRPDRILIRAACLDSTRLIHCAPGILLMQQQRSSLGRGLLGCQPPFSAVSSPAPINACRIKIFRGRKTNNTWQIRGM